MNRFTPTCCRHKLLVVVGLLLICSGVTRADDAYSVTMQRAAKLEKAGRVVEATTVLQSIERSYPQDYALQLQLGWLHFQARAYPAAERHYRRALGLAPSSKDARHGLAWTLLRLGRRQPARIAFEKVLDRWPDTPLAREGLALVSKQRRSTITVSPTVHSTVQLYQAHPSKKAAVDLTASLPLRLLDNWRFDLTYRYSRYWLEQPPRPPWAPPADTGFDQHALFVSGGADYSSWGLVGHYAYLHDGSDLFDYTFLVGVTVRYSPLGDLLLHGNVGVYPDMSIYTIVPAWRVPLQSWLSVTPSLSIQRAEVDTPSPQLDRGESETLLSGAATVTASNSWGKLWVGGRYGTAVRPANLELQIANSSTDRVSYGAWAGGQLRLGGGWSLLAAYELAHLTTPLSPGRSTESSLHLVTIGASWTSKKGNAP